MDSILEMLQELGKLSPFIILMGLFVYYLYQRKNELYIVRDRAIGNEELLKKYLCKNDKLFPKYKNPDGLIKPNKSSKNNGGLFFY